MFDSLNYLSEKEISRRLTAARTMNGAPSPVLPNQIPDDAQGHFDAIIDNTRPAAVLVPLLRKSQDWHLLFTRRNPTLAEHSGQVAFPGGRADPEDQSPEETALREAYEEIGMQPEDVHLLGRLAPFTTITHYHVTPVVGVIPWPYPLRLSEVEVSRVFTIPLTWLADPANYEIQQRTLPSPYGEVDVIFFHPYDNEILWGASARFTLTFLHDLELNNSGSESKK